MKKLKYILFTLALGVFLGGCDDYLDINTNPDASTIVTPEQSLPVVVFYAAQINYDHAEYGNYLSQAFTTGGRSQTGSYAYKSGWEFLTMNRHPQWRRHYYDIGVNVIELMKAADLANSQNFNLIARTIRLMSTQLTTDVFGDMPRSEAYTGTSPKYDTQESIYEWMLHEADELIAAYDDPAIAQNPQNKTITQKMDRIFAGDLNKWRQFTLGIKARILLRKLPNWENNQASCDLIIKTVDQALIGWAEPNYKYDGGTGEANSPWGKAQPSIGGWESRKNELDKAIPSEFFYKDMLGGKDVYSTRNANADDPRMESYLAARVGPKESPVILFRYLKNNIGMGVSYKESNYPDLYNTRDKNGNPYTRNDGYVSLMLTEELYFIKAEALYWKGEKGTAHSVTEEAVRMNMARMKPVIDADPATEAQIYAKQLAELTKFERFEKLYFEDAALNAKYLPANGFNIGHLMRQKYIAMLYQPEMWNDMRRYRFSNNTNHYMYDGVVIYPTLRRPYNLYEAYWINRDPDAPQEWLQRINYDPETEEKYNVEELKRLGAYKNAEWLKKPMVWAIAR